MILFLFGVFVGVLCSGWGHSFDAQYEPARRAVLRQLRAHGTINLKQLERLLDVSGPTVLGFLDRMVSEGSITQHGHRGDGAFYTLVVD